MRDEDKTRESLIAELAKSRSRVADLEACRAQYEQTEAVLRETEERYRAFVANSSEAIWRFETAHPISVSLPEDEQIEQFFTYGYLAECNDTMARMFGKDKAEEFVGARPGDIIDRLDPRNVERLRSFIRLGYRLIEDDLCGTDSKGNMRYFTTSFTGFVEKGFLVRAWGVGQDSTRQKLAEEGLRKAREELERRVEVRTAALINANEALRAEIGERKRVEEASRKFEFIANASREFMTLIDRNYKYEAVNDAYCKAHGKNRQEFISRSVGDVWGWDRFDNIIKGTLDQCFAGKEVHDEAWFDFAGQERRCYQITYYPYFDDRGDVSHAVVVTRDITEQKRTEGALRESKEYLDRIINTISDPIFVKDRQHRLVLVNDAECSLAGRAREELLGRTDYEFFPKEQVDVFWEKDEAVFETGEENINEEEITDSQGILRTIVTKKTLYIDHAGNEFIVGIVRDISDRKKVEEILKESEERLRLAVEVTGLGTWDLDAVTGSLILSDRCRSIFGLSRDEEINYERVLSLMHPEDRAYMREAALRTMKPGFEGTYHSEYRIVRPDGAMRVIDSSGHAFFGEIGGVRRAVRVIGTVADITERKQSEELLRQRAEEVEKLMEVTPVAILVASDPECRRVTGNQTANELLVVSKGVKVSSTSAAEGLKPLFRSLPGGEELTAKDLPLQYAVLHGVDVRDAEVEMIFEDRAQRTFVGNASPLRDERGEVRGGVGAFIDITERKRAEDAILRSEKQLRFLSTRLLETQEEERKRIAAELHDSIGQSLVAMKVRLENALRASARSKAEAVRDSLEPLIPMIQNAMTEVRRIYMGLRPSTLDDLGIIATIGWFCRGFQTTYPDICINRNIRVDENEIPKPLKIVIFRIIQEAMNNVAKHSEALVLGLSLVKEEGVIELIIRDNGVGFDLDSVLSKESSERGLGLTGMRERTELSGGVFAIESIMGEGTTVRTSWTV